MFIDGFEYIGCEDSPAIQSVSNRSNINVNNVDCETNACSSQPEVYLIIHQRLQSDKSDLQRSLPSDLSYYCYDIKSNLR